MNIFEIYLDKIIDLIKKANQDNIITLPENLSGINVDIGMVSAYNRALESGEVYANCKAVKHRYGGGY